MAGASKLVGVLKKEIRKQGISYEVVAKRLGLSESAVKRMFATGNMSLKRLDEICGVLGVDLQDLMRLLDKDQERVEALSPEAEQKLVENSRLLLVAYCIVNSWRLEDILARYDISETQAIQHLAELDRMKMIELLPGNRVKPLISNNFRWQPNGPIERFFRSEVQSKFFGSSFSAESDLRLVKNGDISGKAQLQIVERLMTVGTLFDDISRDERKLPPKQRHGTTMVLAIRHWQFPAFRDLERVN